MNPKYYVELFLLAAIWGSSFLFMRIAAPEFGAVNMAALRIIIAGITLLPVFIIVGRRYLFNQPKQHQITTWQRLTVVTIGNSVIPFLLFAYAALSLEAGLASIVNATTPLWGAFFAVVIYKSLLSKSGWLGLLIGFIGVIILTLHKLSFDLSNDVLAILAVISATCLYGITSNYSKHNLNNIPSLLVASGTMIVGSIIVIPFILWGDNYEHIMSVEMGPWLAIIALGSLCTGFAYILFYRLIEFTSATIAMSVTYLIPIFGVFFGSIFLNEPLFINMLFGGVLILGGVMLATGAASRLKAKVFKNQMINNSHR